MAWPHYGLATLWPGHAMAWPIAEPNRVIGRVDVGYLPRPGSRTVGKTPVLGQSTISHGYNMILRPARRIPTPFIQRQNQQFPRENSSTTSGQ